jgi:hypothetical protein
MTSEQTPPAELVDTAVHASIMAAAERISAVTSVREARDPVNQPIINNWLEAMGVDNPRFTAGEAPPSMAQVWTMYGLGGKPSVDDPLHAMMNVLTDAGFTAVLGTNSEQTYDRYLRIGEQVRVETALDSVVGPKATGMGVGYFVSSRSTWFVGEEKVGSMLFRVLKFIPRTAGGS